MSSKTDYAIDMRNGEHRALVLRTYLMLLAQGVKREIAEEKAPEIALERWRRELDFPGFYDRRA